MDDVGPAASTPTAPVAALAAPGLPVAAPAAPGSSAAAMRHSAVTDTATDTTAKLPDAVPTTVSASTVTLIDVTDAAPATVSESMAMRIDVTDAATETIRNSTPNLPDAAPAAVSAPTGMAIDVSDAVLATISTSTAMRIDAPTEIYTNTNAAPAVTSSSASMLVDVAASAAPATDCAVTFDVARANALVGEEDWPGVESFLRKFLVDVSGKGGEEVIMEHAGLFLIPRQQQLLKMLILKKYDEARAFFDSSIVPLKESKGDYRPLDLELRIVDLDTLLKKMVNKRSSPPKSGETLVELQLAVTDYILLYFPNAICQEEEGRDGQNLWQFVMKIESAPGGRQPKSRKSFRCLACQWECPPSQYSMSSIGYHIAHAQDRKACARVTQNMLDRLSVVFVTKGAVPDMLCLEERMKTKKRKASSSVSMTDQIVSSQQSGKTRSIPSSPSTNTGSIRTVNVPSLGVDPKFASEKAQALQKIAKALVDELEGLSVPDSHRDSVVEKALELENIAHELIIESFKATSRPSQVLVSPARSGSSTRPLSEYRQEKNPAAVVDSSTMVLSEDRPEPERIPAAAEGMPVGEQEAAPHTAPNGGSPSV